jgi:AraC-like DNA-binding protein
MGADALSDVLRAVRLTGAVFFTVDVSPPWATPVPDAATLAPLIMPSAQHLISYHLVTSGSWWAIPAGGAPVRLETGDVIVFPGGVPHVMCSDPNTPLGMAFDIRRVGPVEQWPYRIFGEAEGNERLGLVCGFLGCDTRPFNPLLAALPATLVVSDRNGANDGWLGQFMRLAIAEATDKRAGGESVLGRLSELMFVEAVRRHIDTLPAEQTGWLAGLRDRYIGRALTLLHAQPAHPWTLEELAREVGLSRSALADRFLHLVGHPPMQYLAQWRMQVAAGLLAGGGAGLAEIAADVGYASEAAFSRAFKKIVGEPPAAWRRRRNGAAAATSTVEDPPTP